MANRFQNLILNTVINTEDETAKTTASNLFSFLGFVRFRFYYLFAFTRTKPLELLFEDFKVIKASGDINRGKRAMVGEPPPLWVNFKL